MKFVKVLIKRSRLRGGSVVYLVNPTNIQVKVGWWKEGLSTAPTSKLFIGSGEDCYA